MAPATPIQQRAARWKFTTRGHELSLPSPFAAAARDGRQNAFRRACAARPVE